MLTGGEKHGMCQKNVDYVGKDDRIKVARSWLKMLLSSSQKDRQEKKPS